MVLRKKIRIGLALKGTRTASRWMEAFHTNDGIKVFEISCCFDYETANLFKNLEEIKKLKESSGIEISLHGPPLINIKSGKVHLTFSERTKWFTALSNAFNPEWITVHGFVSEVHLTKSKRSFWLEGLNSVINKLPKDIGRKILIENGFDNFFPATPEEYELINGRRLILDTSHAYYSGGQKRIEAFIDKCNPKVFHISDSNRKATHLPYGGGTIDFSFVKRINGTAIIEIKKKGTGGFYEFLSL